MVSLPPSEPNGGSAGSDLCRYASDELSLLSDGNLDASIGCDIGRRPPLLFAPSSMTEEVTLDMQLLSVVAISRPLSLSLSLCVFTIARLVEGVECAELVSYVERVREIWNRVEDRNERVQTWEMRRVSSERLPW